ncbi:protein kinase [Streptomyces sp. NPDC060194]|uniref:serine/threonine-protein kinase n=1 Tax=Streptomyces sp. NPDC060194 TaxID=3347069 RepID=UPI003668F1B7
MRDAGMVPGQRFGRFTVLAELAHGGMGRVHLARTPAGRTVALKTLLTDSADDRRRFAREVALARRVRGVYTASVVDADPDAAVPWMAQEYVPAPSLKELVEGCGTLGGRALRWVAAGMAEALADLHAARLVHRDVKPSNVLLPLEGPRLIDFGISQAHDLTRTQTALGTVAYASPEQARGEPTTGASDVYSLGATLHYLAVGEPPYRDVEAISAVELLVRAATGDTDVSRLPSGLRDLVVPCLAADPRERPSPAAVVALCAEALGTEHPGTSADGVLGRRWTAAIEAHRAQRVAFVRELADRVDPDAPTGPVRPPDRTARFAPARGPGAGTGPAGGPPRGRGRRPAWWLAAAAVVGMVAGLVVWRPWAPAGPGPAAPPDGPVRFLEVESEQPGVCPDGSAPESNPLATPLPAVPTGRGFTSDDRELCVVVSDAPGMTVEQFRTVEAIRNPDPGAEGWQLRVAFLEQDAADFEDLTDRLHERPPPTDAVAIVQGDSRLIVRVAVATPISGGEAVIATGLGRNEARFLAEVLGG